MFAGAHLAGEIQLSSLRSSWTGYSRLAQSVFFRCQLVAEIHQNGYLTVVIRSNQNLVRGCVFVRVWRKWRFFRAKKVLHEKAIFAVRNAEARV